MRAVPGKDSSAELKVRALLTRMGLRYRLHRRDLPGSPDVVFPGRRLALFVHGCFWHGHDCTRGARVPKANAAYWTAKIARNRARDAATMQALSALGWRSVAVWECELKDMTRLEVRLRGILDRATVQPLRRPSAQEEAACRQEDRATVREPHDTCGQPSSGLKVANISAASGSAFSGT